MRRIGALARDLDRRGRMRAATQAPQPARPSGIVIDDQYAQGAGVVAEPLGDRLELEKDIAGRARARRGRLGEQPVHEVGDFAREVGAEVGDPRWRRRGVAARFGHGVVVGKGRRAGGHLDRDAAEAIEIDRLGRGRITGLDIAGHDLGREDPAVRAERGNLREREPAQHHAVADAAVTARARIDHHGGSGDIADRDAAIVGARHGGDQRAEAGEVDFGSERAGQLVAQEVAFDALADDVLDAVVGTHAVDLDRTRIAHGRTSPCLGDQRWRARVAPGELECDRPVEQHVARFEDDAGIGPADLVANRVGRGDDLAVVQGARRAIAEARWCRKRSRSHQTFLSRLRPSLAS